MALERKALLSISEFIALLLFGCSIQCCYGQEIREETVKLPLCHQSYKTTSFQEANMFNQTSQDEALLHMHTFSPLIVTFCHSDLIFFTCTVHFPRYITVQPEDSPQEMQLQPACRSLCDDIYRECKYAIDKINFHWPHEISCDKFRNDSCVSSDPRIKGQRDVPKNCALTQYRGGTPICSEISALDEKYFGTVNRPFTNYFSHSTQERAIYELSTHARLIHLLITQQPNTNSTNDVTQCLHDVTFLLCNLYLPPCGLKSLQDFPISATQCKNTLEKNCSSAISQIRARGYNITWPPVNVNCDNFPEKPNLSARNIPQFEPQRTFGGLSPPPPAVDYGNVGEDFLEIKWNRFPEEYKFGATVETGILHRKSGSRVQYQHVLTGKNIFRSSGLNSGTTYEILVGTVNSKALFPGTWEKIELKTVRGVEKIKAGFCSSLYNYTKLPNLFGHKTQDKAINSMHTFGPLLNTHCSSDLKALLCSAYLPRYLAKQQTSQPPCQTLCTNVLHRCTYAIRKLNFKWPEELECDKLNQLGPCYPPSPNRTTESERCELVQENSICSFITEPNGTLPYFNTVEKKFKNYFNHTSQQQAVYELSQHARLLSLLSELTATNPETRNQCVQRLAYFLCTLYLPNCRAAIEMSRNDCQKVVDDTSTGVCTSFLTSLRQIGYSIKWPPVEVDCNSISISVATATVRYGEIKFDNMFPPPAVQRYQTLNKSITLNWIDNPNALKVATSYEILFKVVDKMVSYTQKQFTAPKTSVVVPIDTSKDYEIFVAYLVAEQRMPGYFERILYTAGTSVHDLPNDLSLCRSYYDRIVLPNRFGDNMTTAKTRMFPFFPLIYTLCSEDLTPYLCSAIFPRYYFGMQQPCKTTCERILQSCSYAISRTKFLWPSEFKCDSYPTDQCFDVTKVTIPINLNLPEPNKRKKRAALPQCKATTTAMCLAVMKTSPSREGRQVSLFKSTFSEEPLNYFGHKSTDEAIFELSKHLRLLSTLREHAQLKEWDSNCITDLTVLLCHLYLPACPLDRQPQSLCTTALSNVSPCARALSSLNEHALQWPPVQVNCQDEKWFTPNGTIDTVVITRSFLYPPSPPINIVISGKTSDALSVKYKWLDSSLEEEQGGVGVLYRPNNSQKSYSLVRTTRTYPVPPTLDILMLTPATEYEVKVATLDRTNEFPGIFRTITSRTFDVNVFDIPTAIDICYKYYKQTSLPNMYGDQSIASAKLRFLPFYPLVHTFCSSELEAFLCSIFLPRYDPGTYISQKPCQDACERVYQSCQYAIGRSSFLWPEELQCSKFLNVATCYNLTEDKTSDEGSGGVSDDFDGQPARRRRRAVSQDCKPTPSTPICAQVLNNLPEGDQSLSKFQYFKNTFQNGNYFNHSSTNEAVYELSKYFNLLSSLQRDATGDCLNSLTLLLCHLHLPACPPSAISQRSCSQVTTSCFTAIKNLNDKGANFTWPPVNVNCQDTKWFNNTSTFDRYFVQRNGIALPAPRSIHSTPKYSTKIIVLFRPIENLNVTALYRRRGTSAAYQFTTTQTLTTFGNVALDQLIPATNYEIQLASLSPQSGLPGPFVGSLSNTFGQCQNETTGEDIAQGRISWTTQDGSTDQYRKCPYGYVSELAFLNELQSEAIRTCQCDVRGVCKNPFWLEPDMTVCNYKIVNDSNLTLTLSEIAQKLDKDEISLFNASKELVSITLVHAPEFAEDDVILATLILEDIVSDSQQLNETAPNIVKAINNLLNTDADVLLDSQRISNASARMVTVLDQCLENIPLNPGETFTQNETNIAVHGQEYDPRNFTGAGAASILEKTLNNLDVYNNQFSVQPDISQVSITMPRSLFENLDHDTKKKDQRISFVIYRDTSFFTTLHKTKLNPEAKTVRKKNSFVISGSVKGQKLTNLTDPIVTTYQPLDSGIKETTACVFWNFTAKSRSGDWSQVGCTYKGIKDGVVTCHCSHLTNFAILMDVHIDDRNEAHDKALSIISYIGCAISLVGLILTIITILILKDLRTKAPTQILLNFCIALSLTLIVFLVAAERSKTSSLAGCRAAAIALHYFVLAMFVWTSIQAYNMYLAFVRVMPTYHAKFILKCCVVGWGLPAVVVIVTAAVKIEEYGDENFCRVRGLPFQIGFLTPAVLILIINTIAFALIIRSLLTSGSKVSADKRATGLQQARRASAIMVVLGLTWLFGVLAVRDAKLIFQYLFCIFNSIQGLLVFIFYCVLSSETRAKYKILLRSKNAESETSGKQRYPHSSSEGKFHEVNSNKNTRSNVYTTSTGGGSSMSPPHKSNVEMSHLS